MTRDEFNRILRKLQEERAGVEFNNKELSDTKADAYLDSVDSDFRKSDEQEREDILNDANQRLDNEKPMHPETPAYDNLKYDANRFIDSEAPALYKRRSSDSKESLENIRRRLLGK